jgi:N12 class adenine-specific DNA methylase
MMRASESKVNRYFVQNPSMILGKQGGFGTQRFRGQCAVVPNEGENLADTFAEAVKQLSAGIWVHRYRVRKRKRQVSLRPVFGW